MLYCFGVVKKKFIVKIREIPKIKISDLEIRENQIPIPLEITKYQIHLGKQDYYLPNPKIENVLFFISGTIFYEAPMLRESRRVTRFIC